MKGKVFGQIRLQTWLTILVCVVVFVSLSVSGVLTGSRAAKNIRDFQGEKAMDIARTISQTNIVVDGLTGEDSTEDIQRFTKKIQAETNVEYIVVLDKNHIRLSHPVAERIGQYFVGNDEDRAFQGEQYTSIAEGTLGESMRAFVPVKVGEEIIGVVAVGILMDNIQSAVFNSVKVTSYIGIGIGLLVGLIGAFLLSRKVRQTLFGLEPKEIAQHLREREAIFESVRDGIVAIDERGHIVVANRAALNLFKRAGLNEHPVGQAVDDYFPVSSFKDVLLEEKLVYDYEQKFQGIDLVMNRIPVVTGGKIVGTLVTLKDKTELTSLIEQLSGAKSYAERLREQTHEFMNKLHVISAMVHTKSYDELASYTTYLSDAFQERENGLFQYVQDPVIAGYLYGKLNEFEKSHVIVEFLGEGFVPILKEIEKMDKMITIIGNLCDNAYEAVIGQEIKKIQLFIDYKDKHFYFSIQDNGEGIEEENVVGLFEKGVSSKGENRGYGLYLVKQAVDELGGTINAISNVERGVRFSVTIPLEGEEI